MASVCPSEDIFDETEFRINKQFDLIIESLNKRRKRLLIELKHIKVKWQNETQKQFEAIKKLESMRKGIESLCVKDNQFSQVHNASLNPVVQELATLKNNVKYPKLQFSNCDIHPIIGLANSFGELRVITPENENVLNAPPKKVKTVQKKTTRLTPVNAALNAYQNRRQPLSRIQNKGSNRGQFTHVKSLFFCETNNRLYIVSETEHKVLSFTLEGAFISEFGDKILRRPCGIFVNFDYAFVTDETLLGICTFSSGGYLARQLIHSFAARGIVGDNGSQKLYVTDPIANRICVFNFLLVQLKTIEISRALNAPSEIHLFNSVLFLIAPEESDNCLITQSTEGIALRPLIPRAYLQDNSPPVHFCIDSFGNFILSEFYDSQLKVFSSDGDFSCTIGKQHDGIPKAVCVANNRVVCALPGGVIHIF